MPPRRIALAALLVCGLIATGCGGSDDKPKPSSGGSTGSASKRSGAPAAKSAREKMVDCIASQLGFEVKPGDDPDKLLVKSTDGKLKADIVIHPDVGAARKAVAQTLSRGANAVTFGRAEFIRHAANDTESGTIANCISIQYNRPG